MSDPAPPPQPSPEKNSTELPSTNLLELVYEDLRRMARDRLRSERPGHTLQATALVHEAYARVSKGRDSWASRAQFFVASADAMRRILIDHARGRMAQKRGGGNLRITLGDDMVVIDNAAELLEIDDALAQLSAKSERCANIVELRFFAGLSLEDVAEALDISERTVRRDWEFSRAWLFERLR